ncbi:MAG: hypothetical protein IPI29_08565 [Ignavibacteria bacterium]|nr:hypothetical protein [Ignavibacteria bacterium]
MGPIFEQELVRLQLRVDALTKLVGEVTGIFTELLQVIPPQTRDRSYRSKFLLVVGIRLAHFTEDSLMPWSTVVKFAALGSPRTQWLIH